VNRFARFRVDTRYLCAKAPAADSTARFAKTPATAALHDLTDEFGVVWSMPDDQPLYMDISYHPLANATIDDVRRYRFRAATTPRDLPACGQAEKLQTEGFAVCTGIGGVIYEYGWVPSRSEHWFMDMIENPAFCEAVLDRMLRFWTDYYTGLWPRPAAASVCHVGDDLAGQDGPLFRSRISIAPSSSPVRSPGCSTSKTHLARSWYHTCGGCVEYIPI